MPGPMTHLLPVSYSALQGVSMGHVCLPVRACAVLVCVDQLGTSLLARLFNILMVSVDKFASCV